MISCLIVKLRPSWHCFVFLNVVPFAFAICDEILCATHVTTSWTMRQMGTSSNVRATCPWAINCSTIIKPHNLQTFYKFNKTIYSSQTFCTENLLIMIVFTFIFHKPNSLLQVMDNHVHNFFIDLPKCKSTQIICLQK